MQRLLLGVALVASHSLVVVLSLSLPVPRRPEIVQLRVGDDSAITVRVEPAAAGGGTLGTSDEAGSSAFGVAYDGASWLWGEDGQSCDTVCAAHFHRCDPGAISRANRHANFTSFLSKFPQHCPGGSDFTGNWAGHPSVSLTTGQCFLNGAADQDVQENSSLGVDYICSAAIASFSRLCPCTTPRATDYFYSATVFTPTRPSLVVSKGGSANCGATAHTLPPAIKSQRYSATIYGGEGGAGRHVSQGGFAGMVSMQFDVRKGDIIQYYIGCAGQDGRRFADYEDYGGGGGGGSSAILLNGREIMQAGGGGGGAYIAGHGNGGDASERNACGDNGMWLQAGGKGGSLTAGGKGALSMRYRNGVDGTRCQGGDYGTDSLGGEGYCPGGGGESKRGDGGGGGGGGGYYGGGSGASGCSGVAGGGGSSYAVNLLDAWGKTPELGHSTDSTSSLVEIYSIGFVGEVRIPAQEFEGRIFAGINDVHQQITTVVVKACVVNEAGCNSDSMSHATGVPSSTTSHKMSVAKEDYVHVELGDPFDDGGLNVTHFTLVSDILNDDFITENSGNGTLDKFDCVMTNVSPMEMKMTKGCSNYYHANRTQEGSIMVTGLEEQRIPNMDLYWFGIESHAIEGTTSVWTKISAQESSLYAHPGIVFNHKKDLNFEIVYLRLWPSAIGGYNGVSVQYNRMVNGNIEWGTKKTHPGKNMRDRLLKVVMSPWHREIVLDGMSLYTVSGDFRDASPVVGLFAVIQTRADVVTFSSFEREVTLAKRTGNGDTAVSSFLIFREGSSLSPFTATEVRACNPLGCGPSQVGEYVCAEEEEDACLDCNGTVLYGQKYVSEEYENGMVNNLQETKQTAFVELPGSKNVCPSAISMGANEACVAEAPGHCSYYINPLRPRIMTCTQWCQEKGMHCSSMTDDVGNSCNKKNPHSCDFEGETSDKDFICECDPGVSDYETLNVSYCVPHEAAPCRSNLFRAEPQINRACMLVNSSHKDYHFHGTNIGFQKCKALCIADPGCGQFFGGMPASDGSCWTCPPAPNGLVGPFTKPHPLPYRTWTRLPCAPRRLSTSSPCASPLSFEKDGLCWSTCNGLTEALSSIPFAKETTAGGAKQSLETRACSPLFSTIFSTLRASKTQSCQMGGAQHKPTTKASSMPPRVTGGIAQQPAVSLVCLTAQMMAQIILISARILMFLVCLRHAKRLVASDPSLLVKSCVVLTLILVVMPLMFRPRGLCAYGLWITPVVIKCMANFSTFSLKRPALRLGAYLSHPVLTLSLISAHARSDKL